MVYYMLTIGNCLACRRVFKFNPYAVPSLRDQQGKKQPICRTCVDKMNEDNRARGKMEFKVPSDAYDPKEGG